MLDAGTDILFPVYFAVVEDGGVDEFSELEGGHFLDVELIEFGRGTQVDRVVDLWDSFVEVFNLDINEVLSSLNLHKPVDAPVVPLHELNIVVSESRQIGLEVPRNSVLSCNLALEPAAF